MTNTKLLEWYITESGLKKQKIAEVLGITLNALKKKIKGEREFKASEIQKVCDLLHISTLSEKDRVFFATSVE